MSDVDVVRAWQRGEIDGHEARRRTGARSYGDLYRIIKDNDLDLVFRPRDVAKKVAAGDMPVKDGMAAMGIEREADFKAFVAAWIACDT